MVIGIISGIISGVLIIIGQILCNKFNKRAVTERKLYHIFRQAVINLVNDPNYNISVGHNVPFGAPTLTLENYKLVLYEYFCIFNHLSVRQEKTVDEFKELAFEYYDAWRDHGMLDVVKKYTPREVEDIMLSLTGKEMYF